MVIGENDLKEILSIKLKEVDKTSKEYKKNVNDFIQVQAVHDLEGSPLGEYEKQLLMLSATGELTSKQVKKAFSVYLKAGKKLHILDN